MGPPCSTTKSARTSNLPSPSSTMGFVIVLCAQSYSTSAPPSVTERRMCSPPHPPFSSLLPSSTDTLLAPPLAPHEALSTTPVRASAKASADMNKANLLMRHPDQTG